MTLEEVYDIMNGREYLNELTDEEADEMKRSGIVVVFGYSDDNVELRGAVDDELAAFEGAEFYITSDGLFDKPCEYQCKLYREYLRKAKKITAIFDNKGWRFETDIPHTEYSINEDGELFGKGIAFYLKDCGAGNLVDVVRCKDCARGTLETEGTAKGYINCPYQGYGELHPQDWYCADGIRKGEKEQE